MSMKKRIAALGLLLLAGALLCGCYASPLPEGMEADAVLEAGQEVAQLLFDGDYQGVCDRFREDIGDTLTADTVSQLFQEPLDKAGAVRKLDDTRTQGSDEGEPHGIAELYYKCAKKTVLLRIAFDLEMNLIGLDPPKLI